MNVARSDSEIAPLISSKSVAVFISIFSGCNDTRSLISWEAVVSSGKSSLFESTSNDDKDIGCFRRQRLECLINEVRRKHSIVWSAVAIELLPKTPATPACASQAVLIVWPGYKIQEILPSLHLLAHSDLARLWSLSSQQ